MTVAATTPYVGPRTVTDAIRARAEHPDWLILAGGTDLLVPGTAPADPPGVLDLFGARELHGVASHGDVVRVGACTTYAELLGDDSVASTVPLLADAARAVGAEQIRQRGTVGGNVMTCSPVGDLLPGLLALDAVAIVASVRGERAVPYERFVVGHRRVDLARDELLVALDVPVPAAGTVQHWRKVGTRAAQSISKVAMAATALVDDGQVVRCRLAFGAVADRPVRLHDVEALVVGAAPSDDLAGRVEAAVRDAIAPISDVRSTAEYRRDVAARLVARFVASLSRH